MENSLVNLSAEEVTSHHHANQSKTSNDFLILNATSFFSGEIINMHRNPDIRLFLDSRSTGTRCIPQTQAYKKEQYKDEQGLYTGYNDLDHWHQMWAKVSARTGGRAKFAGRVEAQGTKATLFSCPPPRCTIVLQTVDQAALVPSVSAGKRQTQNKNSQYQLCMEQEQKNRNRYVAFRLTQKEYVELVRFWKASTSRKLSNYIRDIVLKEPVHIKTRNLSLDNFLTEIVALRREFKAVGFNFNQVIHKLHTLQNIPEFRAWMLINEKHKELIFSKIKAIQDRINETYDLWLIDSRHTGGTIPTSSLP